MSYLSAHRFGLTRIEPSRELRASGWRQVWEHPAGLLAMRHPVTGRWVVTDGRTLGPEFCSSLRAAARKIDQLSDVTPPPSGAAGAVDE
jgi:hypothetical protein